MVGEALQVLIHCSTAVSGNSSTRTTVLHRLYRKQSRLAG